METRNFQFYLTLGVFSNADFIVGKTIVMAYLPDREHV